MVRGKNVNFSARAINSLFGTLAINTPGELQEFLEDLPPLDTICELICRDNPQWTLIMRERAVMIFAILTYVPFDIGRFLHKSIWKSAMGGLIVGLYHPSFITELCAQASLERQPSNELLQPDSMIHADRRPVGRAQAPLQQEQQFAYQQQWWALWADQMHIATSNRPRYPLDEPAEPPSADMGDE
ncbi:hypothetical protein CDL12_07627 [Handroanthus impetiginosus]|uniref:Uncharacterized protein n=1 Tax=Handroanthus impetiginosus TaxID=429701 RepID=A0A2G9HQX0_9LAMI|nr:hypothetical protein CDL12_07627 [Handroanthus impetiginosus]